MRAPVKTVARLQRRYPRVIEEISYEGEDGTWLYLTPGWIRQGTGTHCVHAWTAKDLVEGMREVEKCTCAECLDYIKDRKKAGVDPNNPKAIKAHVVMRYKEALAKAR